MCEARAGRCVCVELGQGGVCVCGARAGRCVWS